MLDPADQHHEFDDQTWQKMTPKAEPERDALSGAFGSKSRAVMTDKAPPDGSTPPAVNPPSGVDTELIVTYIPSPSHEGMTRGGAAR